MELPSYLKQPKNKIHETLTLKVLGFILSVEAGQRRKLISERQGIRG